MRLCHNPILILIYSACWILKPTPASATFDHVSSVSLLAQATKDILRIGSRGEDVEALQIKLQKLGYYSGAIDGKYGISTRNAVYKFQQEQDLSADGYVGNETRKRLQIKANAFNSSLNPTTQNLPPSSDKNFVWWSLMGVGFLGCVGGLLYIFAWFYQKKQHNGDISATESHHLYNQPLLLPNTTAKNYIATTQESNLLAGELEGEKSNGKELRLSLSPAQLLPVESTAQLAKINIVEELVRDLRSQDASQRRKTIWDLGQQGDSRAMQPLIDLMVDADSQQRSLILAALTEISTRTLKPLNRALALSLQDESPQVRQNAIRDLTRVYDMMAQVSQMLYHATEDRDAEVQATAKYALGQMSRIRSLPPDLSSTSPNSMED